MARRNRSTRRRTRPRRTKRPTMKRGLTLRRNPVYNFVRTKQLSGITLSTVSDTIGRLTFALGDLDNYTEFTNLFQRFRLNAVKIKIVPYYTSNDSNPVGTTYVMPNIHTILDYDDSNTPANLAEFLQYRNHRMTRSNRVHSRYFKPAIQSSVYETAITSAYTPKWKQWLSTDDFATPHYALKYFIDQSSTAFIFRVFVKYYFQCKDLK